MSATAGAGKTGWAVPLCLIILGMAAVGPALASTFNVSPIRAQLGAGRRTEALTITNVDDDPVVVQVRVLAWSQAGGEEILDATREILVTPPVLQMAPKGQQIVRVALRRDPDPARELTYRVILDEVPQAAAVGATGLRVALRLSLPVFVTPAHPTPGPELAWEAHRLPDGAIEIAATNRGSVHVQVIDFEAQVPGAAAPLHAIVAKYVLAGSRVTWSLAPGAQAGHAGTILIRGHSDQGELSADVAYSGS